MVTLAAVHFSFIITYHVINYTIGVVFKSRMQIFVSVLFKMITKKLKSAKNKAVTQYSSEIPEVTYNYNKYQEPLVEDYM